MDMRSLSNSLAFILLLVSGGCALGPTEQDIADSLEGTLRSVAGDWHGTSTGEDAIALDFRLHEGSNGQITGTGSLQAHGAASALPITVLGSYRRPVLALTFIGPGREGERVQGTLQGEYVSVGGVATTLQLTGPNYSRTVAILLQED